jgi:hypothetical protein
MKTLFDAEWQYSNGNGTLYRINDDGRVVKRVGDREYVSCITANEVIVLARLGLIREISDGKQ